MIDLTTIARPTLRKTVVPSPVASFEGTTLITEQQVLFGTAAAVALPRVRPSRWSVAAKAVSGAMSALSRPPAARYKARRFVYLENAQMSREMYRL